MDWRRAVHTGVEHISHRRRARLNVEHSPFWTGVEQSTQRRAQ
ncbi:hypothetical protein A2U01_0106372, partial [Trifolium medium]|nr:hypothetical protein [Trifolium medium]